MVSDIRPLAAGRRITFSEWLGLRSLPDGGVGRSRPIAIAVDSQETAGDRLGDRVESAARARRTIGFAQDRLRTQPGCGSHDRSAIAKPDSLGHVLG